MVLWEGASALSERIVEDGIDDDWLLEDVEDVVSVDVDLELGGVTKTKFDDDSLPEDGKCSMSVDVNLELLDVGENSIDDDLSFEELGVVIDVILGVDDGLERKVDIESILEDTEDGLDDDNDVILESLEVGEDRTDGESVLEDMKDVMNADAGFVSKFIELIEGRDENESVLRDVRDVAGVGVDVISSLEKVFELGIPPMEDEIFTGPAIDEYLFDGEGTDDKLSVHPPPSPKLRVGNAEPPAEAVHMDKFVGNDGTVDAFGDNARPGILSG
ncbi:MAG: hypothetical protein Q9175_004306 [Cornicularia normoerica]